MEITLYKLEAVHKKECAKLLSECFAGDPLFLSVLPDEALRKQMLPVFFECYLEMTFPFCSYYSDSEEMNGIISVWEQDDHFSAARYFAAAAKGWLRFAFALWNADRTGEGLKHLLENRRFFSSGWESELPDEAGLHIDFFAVRPEKQGRGIGEKLMSAVLDAADRYGLRAALETHNSRNLPIYRHFGFRLFTRLSSEKSRVTQYCMVRTAE